MHRPERVDGLILDHATACFRSRPGYDVGLSETEYAERRAIFQTLWGTGVTMNFLAPSLADDERRVEEWARYERMMATPNSILLAFDVLCEVDVRDLLAQVSTRTLVIHSAVDDFSCLGSRPAPRPMNSSSRSVTVELG